MHPQMSEAFGGAYFFCSKLDKYAFGQKKLWLELLINRFKHGIITT